MADFHVIIPAAGSGSRMQAGVPKQYLSLLGKPVIRRTLEIFSTNARIKSIALILSPEDSFWNDADAPIAKLHLHYQGGMTRADTVLNGLEAMRDVVNEDDWILVHDAVRPGLSKATLERLLDALEDDAVGGLLAVPLADTLKRADAEQRIKATEPRENLWQAQTPQMFRYNILSRALKDGIFANAMPTDEAQAIERLGLKPKLVQGELRNFKITYPPDLVMMEAILRADDN
jgi:2-C-methyl-D-erythritol 4-phosphate cytidylyltransferase